jgi:lipid II isoglutaminyl synthase (glutamine-hydrolysing)
VSAPPSPLTVVVVFPDLLGTYGDGGNGVVLARRAAWRGIDVELVEATSDRPIPTGDIYCLGGGEDGPQVRASRTLIADGSIDRAVDKGAVVLGVCAGFQLLGRSFPDAAGGPHDGLGLLDVTSRKGTDLRAVGELVAEPTTGAPVFADGTKLPSLIGFENHSAVTTIGPDAVALARVLHGVGNGDGTGSEGAWSNRVVGTYLHGPVLPRNPVLADLLLGWAIGTEGPLDRLEDVEEQILRAERSAAAPSASGGRSRGLRRRFFSARR